MDATLGSLKLPLLPIPNDNHKCSLIHQLVMGGLFVYTLWAGYFGGWQWRRVRTIQEEINDLKKQVKPATVTPDVYPPPELPPPSQAELKIQQLTEEERKELIKGSFRDRHFNAGSILLGFWVLDSVGGGVNTWFRTGKLFPGPYLFAGAGITVLWALAAALDGTKRVESASFISYSNIFGQGQVITSIRMSGPRPPPVHCSCVENSLECRTNLRARKR